MNIRNIFNKKQQETVVEVAKKSILEQSLEFFDSVLGLEEIKENLYRNLVAQKQINTLLVGPPATSKSLFMRTIYEKMANVVYFDAASGSTGAGLIQVLNKNRTAQVLIIDEIDKLKKNDMNVLLGLLSEGIVSKTLKSETISFKMEGIKVFATSNSTAKLTAPIKSRFEMYGLPEYSDEEFVKVVQHCLKGDINESVAESIANVMISYKKKDVREAINLARKIQKQDTEEDVIRIIENKLKYAVSSDGVDYN